MEHDTDIVREIQETLATPDKPLTQKQVAFLAGAAGFEFGHPMYTLDGIGWDIEGNPTGVADAEQFAYCHGMPVTHQRACEIFEQTMAHRYDDPRLRIERAWEVF